MINVKKYKLDDDSNEDDSMSITRSIKGNKENTNINLENIYNNNYKSNNLENIQKKNYNNQYVDISNKEFNNNTNKNNKFLVDDFNSKILNEDKDDEINNKNYHNFNNNNYLVQSYIEDKFGISNENNRINYDKKVFESGNININQLSNKNITNEEIHNNFNKGNNKQLENNKNKYQKNLIDNSLDLQDFNNNKDDNKFFGKNGNFHHVQIIDEDVENFKRKIDILVKNFKTDSLKDFMSIKRHLLIEQKNAIELEKQKCDSLVGAKTDEIEHLKENLEKTRGALNKEIEIKEKLSFNYYKFKIYKKNQTIKKNIFESIKNHYLKKKNNKKVKYFLFYNNSIPIK